MQYGSKSVRSRILRRKVAKKIEEAEGREIHDTVCTEGGKPADRPRNDAGFERIVRESVIVANGFVEHQALTASAMTRVSIALGSNIFSRMKRPGTRAQMA